MPLAPLASLNLCFFSPVLEFQMKAEGAAPTCPEQAQFLSEEIEREVMSSV
jgi:hypothetical protein